MKNRHSTFMKWTLLLATLAIIALYLVLAVSPQVSATPVVKAQPSKSDPIVGETLTVNITVSNIENLYGVDLTLSWNESVLKFLNSDVRLGVESNPGGTLHEEVYIADNTATQADYSLAATSVAPAPSFNGSGTIALVTFNVTNIGNADLQLVSELADHPQSGQNANLIDHADIAGSVGSVPEFSSIMAIVLFLVLTASAFVYARKKLKKGISNHLPELPTT